jgi:hypothetical protein
LVENFFEGSRTLESPANKRRAIRDVSEEEI